MLMLTKLIICKRHLQALLLNEIKNLLYIFFLILSGCSSVFGESSQRITESTEDRDNKTIENANCILKNDKSS